MVIPIVISVSILTKLEDEFDVTQICLPYYAGSSSSPVNAGTQVCLKVPDDGRARVIAHTTDIAEGTVVSLHTDDDSTSYQNVSGNTAGAILTIDCRGAGTQSRHFKIYSAPTNNSTASATEIFDFDGDGLSLMNAVGEKLTVVIPFTIQNNHFLVLENVDESRAGTNDIRVSDLSWVAEQAIP